MVAKMVKRAAGTPKALALEDEAVDATSLSDEAPTVLTTDSAPL